MFVLFICLYCTQLSNSYVQYHWLPITLTDNLGLKISSNEYNKINDGINIQIIINVGNIAHITSNNPECLN